MRHPGHLRGARTVLWPALLAALACNASPTATPARHESRLEAGSRRDGGSGEVVYTASSVIRVMQDGRVVARMDLRHTVSQMVFDPSGNRAFVATSDGVHVFDARAHRELQRLTQNPARSVVVAAAQKKLYVLENTVRTLADGHNEALPFHLRRFDLERLTQEADVEVGERILAVGVPASSAAPLLMVAESGALATLRYPQGAAEPVAERETAGGRVRVGPVADPDGRTIYVPVEGPDAQILAIDLESGSVSSIALGGGAYLRGLVLSPDGETLYINGLTRVGAVDLAVSGRRGPPDGVSPGVRWSERELPAPHQGLAISRDGRSLYLARPVDGPAGSITRVDSRTLEVVASAKLDDISPFTLAVRP